MLVFAPRIPRELLDYLAVVDDPSLPIAEINRRVGRKAAAIGAYRPSYERVRGLVHQLRRLRRLGAGRAHVLLATAFRALAFEASLSVGAVASVGFRRRPRPHRLL